MQISKTNDSINEITQRIFESIYNRCSICVSCRKCDSKNINLIDDENKIYKCKDCNHSYSPRVNSIYSKIRYTNDRWLKLLKCMILDKTLEETIKDVQSNSESVQKKWTKIFEFVNWEEFNVLVRERPSKNIYANFELIIG